jgi:hypothetical protein
MIISDEGGRFLVPNNIIKDFERVYGYFGSWKSSKVLFKI